MSNDHASPERLGTMMFRSHESTVFSMQDRVAPAEPGQETSRSNLPRVQRAAIDASMDGQAEIRIHSAVLRFETWPIVCVGGNDNVSDAFLACGFGLSIYPIRRLSRFPTL